MPGQLGSGHLPVELGREGSRTEALARSGMLGKGSRQEPCVAYPRPEHRNRGRRQRGWI